MCSGVCKEHTLGICSCCATYHTVTVTCATQKHTFGHASSTILNGPYWTSFEVVILISFTFALLFIIVLTDRDFADDLAIILSLVENAESLLRTLEKTAKLVGPHCNESQVQLHNAEQSWPTNHWRKHHAS